MNDLARFRADLYPSAQALLDETLMEVGHAEADFRAMSNFHLSQNDGEVVCRQISEPLPCGFRSDWRTKINDRWSLHRLLAPAAIEVYGIGPRRNEYWAVRGDGISKAVNEWIRDNNIDPDWRKWTDANKVEWMLRFG